MKPCFHTQSACQGGSVQCHGNSEVLFMATFFVCVVGQNGPGNLITYAKILEQEIDETS